MSNDKLDQAERNILARGSWEEPVRPEDWVELRDALAEGKALPEGPL